MVVVFAKIVVVAVVGVVAARRHTRWEAAEWTTLAGPAAAITSVWAAPLWTGGGEGEEGGGCESVLHRLLWCEGIPPLGELGEK